MDINPFEAQDTIRERLQSFKDVKDIIVIARNTRCTLLGYEEDYIDQKGEIAGYLNVHYKTDEIDNCYAPVHWFSEQITDVISLNEDQKKEKKRRPKNS